MPQLGFDEFDSPFALFSAPVEEIVSIDSVIGSILILPLDNPVMVLCSSFMHGEFPLHGPY